MRYIFWFILVLAIGSISEQGQVPITPSVPVSEDAPAVEANLPPITQPAALEVDPADLHDMLGKLEELRAIDNAQRLVIAQYETANADLEARLVAAKAVVPPAPSAPQAAARAFQPVMAPIAVQPVFSSCGPSGCPPVANQQVQWERYGLFGRRR